MLTHVNKAVSEQGCTCQPLIPGKSFKKSPITVSWTHPHITWQHLAYWMDILCCHSPTSVCNTLVQHQFSHQQQIYLIQCIWTLWYSISERSDTVSLNALIQCPWTLWYSVPEHSDTVSPNTLIQCPWTLVCKWRTCPALLGIQLSIISQEPSFHE